MIQYASLESSDETVLLFPSFSHTLRQRELADFAVEFHDGRVCGGLGSESSSSHFGYDFGRKSEGPEFVWMMTIARLVSERILG